jgi:hypothetical protein
VGLAKYAAEIGSVAMIYIPTSRKTHACIQTLIRGYTKKGLISHKSILGKHVSGIR